MTNEEIARFFSDNQAYIQGNPDLRDPQVSAPDVSLPPEPVAAAATVMVAPEP